MPVTCFSFDLHLLFLLFLLLLLLMLLLLLLLLLLLMLMLLLLLLLFVKIRRQRRCSRRSILCTDCPVYWSLTRLVTSRSQTFDPGVHPCAISR